MAHAQPPPVPPPDRHSALVNLWRMADYMADDFFVPNPSSSKELPLYWKFQNVEQTLRMQTTSAHTTPLKLIYRITLGDATPGVRYMLLYVTWPKDRDNLQANKAAFKRAVVELIEDSTLSMSDVNAE